MVWILTSITTLIISCLIADWNRKHKYDAISLNFWRTIISIIVLSPVLFLDNWPQGSHFYILSIIIGIGSGLGILAIFHLASKFNGRVSMLSNSVTVLLTFSGWLILDSSTRTNFLNTPLKSMMIILIMLTACFALLKMRRQPNTKKEHYLYIVVIMGIISAVVTLIGKTALPQSISQNLGLKILIMGFIIFIVQWILSLLLILHRKYIKKGAGFNIKKHLNKHVLTLGLLGSISCITSWVAIALAPNPAYVKAILMSAPLLLLGYHKLKNIEDDANPIAGTVLVVCVILLILIQ